MESAELFMKRAMLLAAHGTGCVSPNPMVGALLVYQGRIIGEGWHRRYGEAHAEVSCLSSVGAADAPLIPESTMYVTLEPCAHHGRTPPCANRLVDEGIRHVVIANADPFPKVQGRGIAILEACGIAVVTGMLAAEGRWLNRRFFTAQEKHRPYIILKWAESRDGYMAPADLGRLQLSNSFSQALSHRWRTEESAILVGYNTALNDNPRLNARSWQGLQPLRIAMDRYAALPVAHHLFDGGQETWVLTSLPDAAAPYVHAPIDDELIPFLLKELMASGKNSLIVEGGQKLLRAFIKAGLWDEARVFKTGAMLCDGLASPDLPNAAFADNFEFGSDRLEILLNQSCGFHYTPGLPF